MSPTPLSWTVLVGTRPSPQHFLRVMSFSCSRQSLTSLSLSTKKGHCLVRPWLDIFHHFLDLPLQTVTGNDIIIRPLDKFVILACGSASGNTFSWRFNENVSAFVP